MFRYLKKSILLLSLLVFICCVLYVLVLWGVGQTFFPFQSNGSIVSGPDGKPVGSLLIGQPFTKDEYFKPRPSAASYDASASASSSLAASNYALRDRAARTLGPIATYGGGPKTGQPVAPDVEAWFQKDVFQGNPHIVAQWADLHNGLAQAWVKADPANVAYVDAWTGEHQALVDQWAKDNPETQKPQAANLAVLFFEHFSNDYPGKFPSAVAHTGADGKAVTSIEPISEGADIQSVFFDMWVQDHPNAVLQDVPADMVTASASGLDPHISVRNAALQIDRVTSKWAENLKRDPNEVRKEIEGILSEKKTAPWFGLVGEPFVNVLEVNLELRNRYGAPSD